MTLATHKINGLIFDLDGVLVDTAKHHFSAWRRVANELGFDFTLEQNEQLKGVSRVNSLKQILTWGGIELAVEEFENWLYTKNEWYKELISTIDQSDLLPGIPSFLNEAQQLGIKLSVGSASKNAVTILTKLQVIDIFEAVIDGTMVKRSKPDPEVFIKAAMQMKLNPNQCIVFEDAQKGVDAAKAGGFHAIGIGSEDDLTGADFVFPNLINHNPSRILALFQATSGISL